MAKTLQRPTAFSSGRPADGHTWPRPCFLPVSHSSEKPLLNSKDGSLKASCQAGVVVSNWVSCYFSVKRQVVINTVFIFLLCPHPCSWFSASFTEAFYSSFTSCFISLVAQSLAHVCPCRWHHGGGSGGPGEELDIFINSCWFLFYGFDLRAWQFLNLIS